MARQTMVTKWSPDYQQWMIDDPARIGLFVCDTNKSRGQLRMRDLQREYDMDQEVTRLGEKPDSF